jgi:hypothetical protein
VQFDLAPVASATIALLCSSAFPVFSTSALARPDSSRPAPFCVANDFRTKRSRSSKPRDKALPRFGGTLTRRWNWQLPHYFLVSSCKRVDDLDVSQSFSWAELHLGRAVPPHAPSKNQEANWNAWPIPSRESRGNVTKFAGLLTGSVFRSLLASVLNIWPAHTPPQVLCVF